MATGRLRGILAKAFRIFESTVWNSNGRAEAKELQDLLGREYLGTTPANYSSCVLGGLVCSAVGGTMDTIVSQGSAFIYDSAITGALGGDSKYVYTPLEVATQVTHAAADAVHPRIDVVYITSTKGNAPGSAHDVKKHALDGGGVELGLSTQEGSIPTLGILIGTPAAAPIADLAGIAALDGIPLYAVWVPALAADAALFSYADRRPAASPASSEPVAGFIEPLVFRGAPLTTSFSTVAGDFKRAASGDSTLVRLLANGRASAPLGWDSAVELPYYFRDVGLLSGVGLGGKVYPMTQQAGPSHIASHPVRITAADHVSAGTIPTDYTWDSTGYGLHVTHVNASVLSPYGSQLIPVTDRGVKLTRAWVTSSHFVAFVTGIAKVRLLQWDESAQAVVNLIDTAVHATGYQTLVDAGGGARSTMELDLDAALLPSVWPVGDFVVLEVTFDFQAGDANTEVFVWTNRLEWTDGRG